MGDRRNWPKKFFLEFIVLYKSHPCLWNTLHQHYYDRTKRNEAYQALITKLGEIHNNPTKMLCVHKLDSLKRYFRREYSKVMLSRKHGGPIYKPKLWYFKELMFLMENHTITKDAAEIQEDMDFFGDIGSNYSEKV